jgi:hypothetical protein
VTGATVTSMATVSTPTPAPAPRPLVSAAPFALLGAVAVALALALAAKRVADVAWVVGGVAAVCFSTAAALRAFVAERELRRLRAAADRLILEQHRGVLQSQLVRWRSAELTADKRRRRMSKELEVMLRRLSPGRLPSASPLNRPAARRSQDLLGLLAERLDDSRPIAPRGILLAERLLRSPGSPLYDDRGGRTLPRAIERVLQALEP